MNVEEYWQIVKKDIYFFGVSAALLWLLSFAWFSLQAPKFEGVLLLNVGRTAAPSETPAPGVKEYTYDNFYRLQADERFADTLVRWLANPRIVSDVLVTAGSSSDLYTTKELSRYFQAKRLSSQVVEVRYAARNRDTLYRYSEAIDKVLARYTETLNGNQENWFRVVGSDPVIRDARIPAWPFLAISALVSIFLAFWLVFIKSYFQAIFGQHGNANRS